MSETSQQLFMAEAIRLSEDSINQGGGPFGAVVVKNGEIVGKGANGVTRFNDPTAHAEVSAIRDAAKRLNTYDLSGCDIYTSCEPCPMCLGAIYWARINRIFYGNTKADAAKIGFDDAFIYQELDKPLNERSLPMVSMMAKDASTAFRRWTEKADKTPY
jgi:guanine deaminase